MSPDPPRTDTHEDEDDELSNAGVVYFVPLPMDDEDFMADENAVHELDYNTHDDSDFSDDEDHHRRGPRHEAHNPENSNNNNNNTNNEPVTTNTRMMARYQLLIPFPPPESLTTESSDAENEAASLDTAPAGGSEEQLNPENQLSSSSSPNNPIVTETKPTVSSGDNKSENVPSITKREINLTEDKVEIIKNVMSGFTLPPSSIPNWAEQIDDAAWKEKLGAVIEKKPPTIPSSKLHHK